MIFFRRVKLGSVLIKDSHSALSAVIVKLQLKAVINISFTPQVSKHVCNWLVTPYQVRKQVCNWPGMPYEVSMPVCNWLVTPYEVSRQVSRQACNAYK